MQALWDHSVKGECNLVDANYYYATASGGLCRVPFEIPLKSQQSTDIMLAWNAATDIVLALYPIGIVYHLQMAKKVKIGLCVLMGLGLFTAVCSLVKVYWYKEIKASMDPTCELRSLQRRPASAADKIDSRHGSDVGCMGYVRAVGCPDHRVDPALVADHQGDR